MRTIPTIKRLPTRLSMYDIEGMTISERRNFLKDYLTKNFYGNSYWCNALGCLVKVSGRSIKETSQHASKSYASTIVAINLPTIIKHSVLVGSDKPKRGTQTKYFYAVRMYELHAFHNEFGTIKLMIAKDKKGNRYEYCITVIKIKALRNWASTSDKRLS